jgi:3',5'-cyclic AMP phosphodiesterase CpdA
MALTILHLSDLHRSAADPIGNDELLSALLADRDRAQGEDPALPQPDAIVVTGDLVQGVKIGDADHAAKLDEQYAVARSFLESIVEHFLDGDRARLVILQGNHDVDWNVAYAAMEVLAEDEVPAGFSLASCAGDSDLRWSWRERRVYRIKDHELYAQRLARFDQLADEFYEGVDVVRDPQFRIHELAAGRVRVVAFDSCRGNDCFADHGEIDEGALARAHFELREQSPDLAIAAWHHSIEGPPTASDYMDSATVAEMTAKGFRLGLHGHQHRAAAVHRYIHLPGEERMAVVSAGSLCADRFHLPVGVNRQYNVVEIAEDLQSARVHVREMVVAKIFGAARRPEFGLKTYVEISWTPPPSPTSTEEVRMSQQVIDAERALRENRAAEVPAILQGVPVEPNSYARTLLLEALEVEEAWEDVVALLALPSNVEELHRGARAMLESDDPNGAEAYLDSHRERLGLQPHDVQDLQKHIVAKKALGK